MTLLYIIARPLFFSFYRVSLDISGWVSMPYFLLRKESPRSNWRWCRKRVWPKNCCRCPAAITAPRCSISVVRTGNFELLQNSPCLMLCMHSSGSPQRRLAWTMNLTSDLTFRSSDTLIYVWQRASVSCNLCHLTSSSIRVWAMIALNS